VETGRISSPAARRSASEPVERATFLLKHFAPSIALHHVGSDMNHQAPLHMRTRLLWRTLLCLAGLTASAPAQPLAASLQLSRHFEAEIRVTARRDYLLFLPDGYAKSKQRWPLMLFLHGAGESGTN